MRQQMISFRVFEMEWHPPDHTETICTSLQTNTSSLNFYGSDALHNTQPNTHTHPFNGPLSETTRMRRYQKAKPIWI